MSKFILLIFLTTKIEEKKIPIDVGLDPSDVGSDPFSQVMPESVPTMVGSNPFFNELVFT